MRFRGNFGKLSGSFYTFLAEFLCKLVYFPRKLMRTYIPSTLIVKEILRLENCQKNYHFSRHVRRSAALMVLEHHSIQRPRGVCSSMVVTWAFAFECVRWLQLVLYQLLHSGGKVKRQTRIDVVHQPLKVCCHHVDDFCPAGEISSTFSLELCFKHFED